MAAFAVMILIVAHRFLRLDLTHDAVARLHPPALLIGLLAVAMLHDSLRGGLRLRLLLPIALQWALWAWAGVTKLVADGAGSLRGFVTDDFTKDVVFASLLATLCDSLRRLKTLSGIFVAAMTFIALMTLPQHDGERRCYHYDFAEVLNYVQTTDNRKCATTTECYDVPKRESALKDAGWACERVGPWGLASVIGRIHYVGNLADPNAEAQALVMACALALGLLFWPQRAPDNDDDDGHADHDEPDGHPAAAPWRRLAARLSLVLSLAVMGVAVIYCASRAAQAALAVTLLAFFATRVGVLGALLGAAGAVPLLLITQRNDAEAAYSSLTRAQTAVNGYLALLDQPLFGVGFGNYEKISFITAHNSFLLSATETGVIGGALFVLAVYVSFKFLVQIARWPDAEGPATAPRAPTHHDDHDDHERPDRHEIRELRHFALTLLSMLLGVGLCVTFLSLSYDVMWLFPVGVVAAFYGVCRDRLPAFELRLSGREIAAVLLGGAALPAIFAVLATRAL